VSRQRTPDTLERELPNRLDCHSVLNGHQDAGANEDLPWLGFIAKPRSHIGHRPDSGIVEASLEADCAQRCKPVGDADAEANVMSEPTSLLGQRSNNVAHFERHQHRLERWLLDWHWIVEHHHYPVASVTFEGAAVFDDDFANGCMVVAQERHHV
jgi:hypothetical protein